MDEKIILIGGGGHSKVIIDAIKKGGQYSIEGIIDGNKEKGNKVLDVPVLGGDNELAKLYASGVKNAFIAFGSIGDCGSRKKMDKVLKDIGYNLPVVIHPKAVVAEEVEIKEGTFIAASATINPGTSIGRNSIINTSSSIDHDCQLGDFIHIAPGAILSGEVMVGDETHIGTGASVIQCIKIGKRCMIGAGAKVFKNVNDGEKVLDRSL